jgi:hypothetical protein
LSNSIDPGRETKKNSIFLSLQFFQ